MVDQKKICRGRGERLMAGWFICERCNSMSATGKENVCDRCIYEQINKGEADITKRACIECAAVYVGALTCPDCSAPGEPIVAGQQLVISVSPPIKEE